MNLKDDYERLVIVLALVRASVKTVFRFEKHKNNSGFSKIENHFFLFTAKGRQSRAGVTALLHETLRDPQLRPLSSLHTATKHLATHLCTSLSLQTPPTASLTRVSPGGAPAPPFP